MTTTKFRYYGVTDDQVVCDNCGKDDLKKTVILMTLDDEGNDDGLVYFGTTCAARALAARYGVRTTAARVLREAEVAEFERRRIADHARQLLGVYGIPVDGPVSDELVDAAAVKYAEAHRAAAWARTADWRALVLDMITRRRAQITA